MNSLKAELFLVRKRTAFWVLLGFWSAAALLFSYILPYYAYTSDIDFHGRAGGFLLLLALLPQNLVSNITGSFPFFGGTVVFILGALAVGSEYSWGTLTPVYCQGAGRLKVFFAKIAAIAIALILFVVLVFFLGLSAGELIAWREGQALALPPTWELVRAMGAAWFLMAAWASFGVLLAVLFRGTSLAIGLGIIYGLVLEGLISSFGQQIEQLGKVSQGLLRTNGYSLISSLGVTIQGEVGPGQYSIDVVSGWQATAVLGLYIALFVTIAAVLIRRRDVGGASG